jgi:DNA end-binding protein Ku
MAARSSWKGYLRLSLVSIPVKAYTAAVSGGGEIHLNQVHAECHSRIKYQKTCPIHGEVSNDAIVSGYEFAKGQFIIIDPEELNKLRTESDKAIQIDSFVTPDTIDAVYFNGRNYYLVPDGPVGQKPYALLLQGMKELERYAVAQVVMHGREQVVLLRPVDGLMAMSILSYDAQIVKPSAFESEAPAQELAPAELDLVKTLIKAQTPKEFHFDKFKDTYTDQLGKLIEAKVQGKEIVAAPAHEEAQVINLMEALKESVAKVQHAVSAEEAAKPPKKMAKSVPPKKAQERKRKSS